MSDGTLTGSTSYILTDAGDFIRTAGTISVSVLRLTLTNVAATYNDGAGAVLYDLVVTGNLTILNYPSFIHLLQIDSGASVIVPPGQTPTVSFYAGTTFTNNGDVYLGSGSLFVLRPYADVSIGDLGSIIGSGTVYVYIGNTAVASRTITLSHAWDVQAQLKVQSDHAANTVTVDVSTSNYSISAKDITIATRGILNARASTIDCAGDWNVSGTFTEGTSTVRLIGADAYVDLPAGQKFYNLTVGSSGLLQFNQTTEVYGVYGAYGAWINGPIQIQNASNPVLVHDQWNGSIESIAGMIVQGDHYTLTVAPVSGGMIISDVAFSGAIPLQTPTGPSIYPIIPSGNVITFGDSISTPTFVNFLGNLTGMTVTNQQHSGETTGMLLPRFNAEVVAAAPDYVLIIAGFNDISGYSTACNLTQTEGNLTTMYDAAIAASIKVIATTITPWNARATNDSYYALHDALNTWIKAQASTSIQVLDFDLLNAHPTDPRQMNPRYSSDGVHPNFAGSLRMANLTYSQLFIGTIYTHQNSIAIWTVSGASSAITFTLSGLESGGIYRLFIDGERVSTLTASGSGVVSFTYSGPWSEHEFEIEYTSISGSIGPLVGLILLFFALGIVIMPVMWVVKLTKLKKPPTIDQVINVLVFIIVGLAAVGVVYTMI